uniref:Class I SAM-dependent methyltransferase n=1 Tax=candidate division WWE3 bacterium TaxID=2053526 RepID=A0A832E1X5_UNCKA
MKLHLGCGEIYLEGYVNIDYPSSKHTVQTKSVADEHHDITKLRYPEGSIEEVRLHHVFEHFSRSVALALLASWWSWLKPGGLLRVEVPDFDRMARVVLNPFVSSKSKGKALRHIFGAQEAPWAVHFEGWSARRLARVCTEFGFRIEKINRISWNGLHNIEIFARKVDDSLTLSDFEERAKNTLSLYLVNESETEKRMLEVWLRVYRAQVGRSFAKWKDSL